MSTRTSATFNPPILAAKTWASNTPLPDGLSLLDFSQAAPSTPPPAPMLDAMAETVRTNAAAHLYGHVLGNADLRAALAAKMSAAYGAAITTAQVGITSGCNQAFAAAIAALTDQGDEVILPTPWYFNHKMCLDMAGVHAVPLETGADLLPDPNRARSLITSKTRAIVLISPNNPTGLELDPKLIEAFYLLAREHGIHLILDETYWDFRAGDGVAHDLFQDPDWPHALIRLYSFSKSFHLSGHRIGAITCAAHLMADITKYLDTITICPSGIGQAAVLWGLEHLDDWLASERQEILNRGAKVRQVFDRLTDQGWLLLSSGAYFAYVDHPDAVKHDNASQYLLEETGILTLPATMFLPDGTAKARRQFRIAFANLGADGIADMGQRLQEFSF